jgi:predicted TIM-barrel fold metal-dependent hydrolase
MSATGWTGNEAKTHLLRSLVLEVIDLFGAHRCMFASNWHINGAVSISDGNEFDGISMTDLFSHYDGWVADFPLDKRDDLFAGTAERFYKVKAS